MENIKLKVDRADSAEFEIGAGWLLKIRRRNRRDQEHELFAPRPEVEFKRDYAAVAEARLGVPAAQYLTWLKQNTQEQRDALLRAMRQAEDDYNRAAIGGDARDPPLGVKKAVAELLDGGCPRASRCRACEDLKRWGMHEPKW